MRVNSKTRTLTTAALLGVFGISLITSTFIYAQGRRGHRRAWHREPTWSASLMETWI